MKMTDVRALSSDQVKDEILKLRKEQLNLRFQRASGQLEKPRASARSAVTLLVSRQAKLQHQPQQRSRSIKDAETHIAGCCHQRQERQDNRCESGAPFAASRFQKDGSFVEEVSRA